MVRLVATHSISSMHGSVHEPCKEPLKANIPRLLGRIQTELLVLVLCGDERGSDGAVAYTLLRCTDLRMSK